MAKANPLKGGWKRAVLNFIQDVQGEAAELTLDELDILAVEARRKKTEMDRGKTWYEAIRDKIVPAMMKLELVERFASNRTFYKISPCMEMGKDETGRKKYDSLVEKYGQEWVNKNVLVTTENVPATQVTTYDFLKSGTTLEELQWTIAMGNKPSFEVGNAPKRAKQGEARRKRT